MNSMLALLKRLKMYLLPAGGSFIKLPKLDTIIKYLKKLRRFPKHELTKTVNKLYIINELTVKVNTDLSSATV